MANKYEFDAVRWLRGNAGRIGTNWVNGDDIAAAIADEIQRLRVENDALRNESRVYRAQCAMRDEWRDKLEGELAALRDAARPVVAMRKRLEDDTRKGDFEDEWIDALDALAALVGEG